MRDPNVAPADISRWKRILFWTELPDSSMDAIDAQVKRLEAKSQTLGALARGVWASLQGTGTVGRDPRHWVTDKVPRGIREEVGKVLAQGNRGIAYMGRAKCRICDRDLGNADLYGFGFVWPEKAEHYILDHDVWTPECNDLYMAIVGDILDEHRGKHS